MEGAGGGSWEPEAEAASRREPGLPGAGPSLTLKRHLCTCCHLQSLHSPAAPSWDGSEQPDPLPHIGAQQPLRCPTCPSS